MRGLETTLGGSREGFPETVWSTVLARGGTPSAERDEALNRLSSLYWRPVYRFIRTAGGATIEDAKDLTQEFFSYLMEGNVLSKYDGQKGRFRSFLKGVLRNFLSESHRNATRLKRGGGKIAVSLDVEAIERSGAQSQKESPETQFDRQWSMEVFSESLAALKADLLSEGKGDCLKVYEAYYGADASPSLEPSYERIASALGFSRQQVKSDLDFARARFKRIVRQKLSQGVSSFEELSVELSDLLFG
jgi:RNA polymerase sigma factor (sigma-70 family)